PRARPHARPDAHLLQGRPGQARDRAGPRQGPVRQARGDQGTRVAARHGARDPRGEPVALLPDHRHESPSFLNASPGIIAAVRSTGTLMALGSGAAFGCMAIFGKLAYGEGATVGTLLSLRFILAAAIFWALLALRRAPIRRLA